MPYRLIWEGTVVTKAFSGLVTSGDLFNAMNGVEGDERFDQLTYTINDFAAVTAVDLTEDHVEEHAAYDHAAARSNPRIVIGIVSTDPKILALVNSYARSQLAPYRTELFATLADARRAAGLMASE